MCMNSPYPKSDNSVLKVQKVKNWITSRNTIRRIHDIGYAVSRIWEDRLDKIEITLWVVSREALLFTAKVSLRGRRLVRVKEGMEDYFTSKRCRRLELSRQQQPWSLAQTVWSSLARSIKASSSVLQLNEDTILLHKDGDQVVGNEGITPSLESHNVNTSEQVQEEELGRGHPVKDKRWRSAMDSELEALEQNKTWAIEKLASNKKALGCKWVYKIKYKSDGTIERFKARLVILGNHQVAGVDYSETFAPVAKMATVRVFLAIAAAKQWELHQMDVHDTFLHSYILNTPIFNTIDQFQKFEIALHIVQNKRRIDTSLEPKEAWKRLNDLLTGNNKTSVASQWLVVAGCSSLSESIFVPE
ncbi:retrovirus-related pol polyprotein from transposon TNT 1-94 [Tanacetum coccineum]